MPKYRIAWLPGDGVGTEVLQATRIVLDRLAVDAEYPHGDIGWDFWCLEGNPFPQRSVELLKNVDAALFGAITSKPVEEAERELAPQLQGQDLVYRSPIIRLRQLFDLYICLRPCKAFVKTQRIYTQVSSLAQCQRGYPEFWKRYLPHLPRSKGSRVIS